MSSTSSPLPILPTSLVGSYAQPDWLIDRAKLAGRFPPRVRAKELWRVDPEHLEQAQNDATMLAIRAQEEAGLDIITDGEMRRESYSNHFATALEGVDIDNPGTALDRSGHPNPVPRIAGPIVRRQPIEVRDVEFLKAHTDHTVKMTVPGPFTMSQQAQNDHYPDLASAALAYAAAVNAEIKDLHAAGADLVQIDEPYMQARPDAAREYGLAALNAALDALDSEPESPRLFGRVASRALPVDRIAKASPRVGKPARRVVDTAAGFRLRRQRREHRAAHQARVAGHRLRQRRRRRVEGVLLDLRLWRGSPYGTGSHRCDQRADGAPTVTAPHFRHSLVGVPSWPKRSHRRLRRWAAVMRMTSGCSPDASSSPSRCRRTQSDRIGGSTGAVWGFGPI